MSPFGGVSSWPLKLSPSVGLKKSYRNHLFYDIFNAIYTLNSILFHSIGDEEGGGADSGRSDGVGGGDGSCISIPGLM